MLYYLNNCKNLKHADIYGGDAIFDLWAFGFEDKVIQEFSPGDTCVVASRADAKNVVMSWYIFTGARHVEDGEGRQIWVIEGKFARREVLPKTDAARHDMYCQFFDKLGRFKQQSVLRGT